MHCIKCLSLYELMDDIFKDYLRQEIVEYNGWLFP